MNRRAQMEIFGLIIVVMLLFMGMLFMMTTGATKKSDAKNSYVAHQVAANVLNSLLATKVVCTLDYNLTLTELLQDCATENDIYCDQSNLTYYGVNEMMSACQFSEIVIGHVLNETLNKWSVRYFLTLTKDETEFTNEFDEYTISFVNPLTIPYRGTTAPGCQRKYGGTSKMFPVPLYPGTLWIELFVCD
ncbi:hypothetical protein JXM83_06065 [Candidatus Woesearchaeota archaeon]|nr:hypothetical protein [Candidatus Woesearchaeota archaeon]